MESQIRGKWTKAEIFGIQKEESDFRKKSSTISTTMFKRKIVLIFLILGIGISFSGGVLVGRYTKICPICPPEKVDFSLLWQAWDTLEKKYADPQKLDTQEMIYGAVSGMVKSIGDPYTTFLDPQESKTFLEDVSGTFEGVGMEIGIRKGDLQVIAPLEGTPAQRAGLRAGDQILKVESKLTADLSLEEVVHRIRGPKGTKVTLTIFREGWDQPQDFTIKRAEIEIPSLTWELKEENIAYVKLYHFTEKASSDFREVALEILQSPAKKIILDLRNNPGGYLEVAQDIGGWFLERGQVVVIEDFGEGKEQKIHRAHGNQQFVDYPMVCLINEGSASGAEILAGALRDNRGIKLIGQTSFGKGSVQTLSELKDESRLKITVAKWLTPHGKQISEIGLKPDIKIEMTEEDYQQGKDPQLKKAIEIIK